MTRITTRLLPCSSTSSFHPPAAAAKPWWCGQSHRWWHTAHDEELLSLLPHGSEGKKECHQWNAAIYWMMSQGLIVPLPLNIHHLFTWAYNSLSPYWVTHPDLTHCFMEPWNVPFTMTMKPVELPTRISPNCFTPSTLSDVSHASSSPTSNSIDRSILRCSEALPCK